MFEFLAADLYSRIDFSFDSDTGIYHTHFETKMWREQFWLYFIPYL